MIVLRFKSKENEKISFDGCSYRSSIFSHLVATKQLNAEQATADSIRIADSIAAVEAAAAEAAAAAAAADTVAVDSAAVVAE